VDLVLGADVVWVEPLIAPLVSTLAHVARRAHAAALDASAADAGAVGDAGAVWDSAKRPAGPGPVFLLSHQTRSHASDRLLLSLLAEAGFVVRSLPPEAMHPRFAHPDIAILHLRWFPPVATATAVPGGGS